MQNISLRSSGMRRKQNFAFSPPLFFRFSRLIFFSLAGHLVGFVLLGRVFRKAFRILGLGERKGRWAMEQDFHGDFQVNVTWFFTSFSGVLSWIVLILVWFQRSLHSAQVKGQSCPWPLRLMTSQTVERTWIRVGGYRRFSIKWPAYSTFIQRGYATRSHKPITVMSTKLIKRLSNRTVWNMQAILCLLHIRGIR